MYREYEKVHCIRQSNNENTTPRKSSPQKEIDDSDSSELEFTTTIKACPRRSSSVHSVSSGRVASSRSSKTTNLNKDGSDDLWNTDSENEFEG
jgi:hypothetical protein